MFGWLAAAKDSAVEFALLFPAGIFPWIWAIKIFSFTLYLLQIPLTYAIRRLDYEMRWYLVTDRSLRLRHGVWKVNESTMSFANVQQVEVSQGPLQRLLGLADVKVKSAGGGSNPQHPQTSDDMHVGLFHSVTNAPEVRDLIIDRLRRYREAGLGDPEEKHETPVDAADRVLTNAATPDASAIAAARALAEEARALRQTLQDVAAFVRMREGR
jgi:membrane protein YdbS with pleckstrin-like domain